MDRSRLVLAVAWVLISLLPLLAFDKPKPAPLSSRETDTRSGKQMFQEYCAACHRSNGHGSARMRAPDLTTIAKRRHMKDVSGYVQQVLADDKISAHKTSGMPDWRPILFRLSGGKDDEARLRRVNLGDFVASLQGK